jgi:alpha-tubulin suppressor-like RCC1 family protein
VSTSTLNICNIDSSKVYCWGNGNYGALGNGFDTGTQVTPLEVNVSNATSLSGGLNFTCALLSDSTINCWGTNSPYGQLGNGSTSNSVGPVEVSGISNARKIDSTVEDGSHSCALLLDGGVKCWGKGTSGQLGNGANSTSFVPVYVSGFE